MRTISLLFLLPLLLVACTTVTIPTTPPTTLQEELEILTVPASYRVTQVVNNSGFAGAPNTGAYNEATTFIVKNGEVIKEEGERTQPLLLMVDIKETLWQYVEDASQLKEGVGRCYQYEQWGVERMTVCFTPDGITSYESLKTYGNHQTERTSWNAIIQLPD